MAYQLPLTTARLLLRDFVKDDWPAVHAYASDPEVARYEIWGPNDQAASRAYILQKLMNQVAAPRTDFDLAVLLKADSKLIGACGLRISSPEERAAHLGYVFNHGLWGHGYATEAARALLAFGFEQLELHRIFATCDAENAASARVLEKIGMRREGHFRRNVWQKGQWRDSYYYALLEDEWREQIK